MGTAQSRRAPNVVVAASLAEAAEGLAVAAVDAPAPTTTRGQAMAPAVHLAARRKVLSTNHLSDLDQILGWLDAAH